MRRPEGLQVLNKMAIEPQDVARAIVFLLNLLNNVTVKDLPPMRQDW